MVLRAIWQFTDWAVQARMVYGPKRRMEHDISIINNKHGYVRYF